MAIFAFSIYQMGQKFYKIFCSVYISLQTYIFFNAESNDWTFLQVVYCIHVSCVYVPHMFSLLILFLRVGVLFSMYNIWLDDSWNSLSIRRSITFCTKLISLPISRQSDFGVRRIWTTVRKLSVQYHHVHSDYKWKVFQLSICELK